jgi:hypothetical protein
MKGLYHRVLFLFVDGVGLAPASASNPFSTVGTPALERLLAGPLTLESRTASNRLVLTGLDATLGFAGLPQSATGQASLFTGRNGAAVLGRHMTGLPGPRMRAFIEAGNLLRQARSADRQVTFANAYTRGYLDDLAAGRRRASLTTTMARSAGLRFRLVEDLERSEAVTWDYCRDLAAGSGIDVAPIDARTAGTHLAGIAARAHLTLHETFLTDLAGHLKRGVEPHTAVERLDGVVAGLVEAADRDLTWVLTSDHGNLEDVSVSTHTRNPVPLLAVGPAAALFAGARSILDVTPRVLAALGVDAGSTGDPGVPD